MRSGGRVMDAQKLVTAINATIASVEVFMASKECPPDAYVMNVQIIGTLRLLAEAIAEQSA
jgi:hypothetical protein